MSTSVSEAGTSPETVVRIGWSTRTGMSHPNGVYRADLPVLIVRAMSAKQVMEEM